MEVYKNKKDIMTFKERAREESDNEQIEVAYHCAVKIKHGKVYGGGYYDSLNSMYDDDFELENEEYGESFRIDDIETLVIFSKI